ncbi:flavohemoglobin expression-modulating QEGLA motif protein, partial [Patescibacteria group bacterium]|nr:flavohemoglobin expression-modulating QEGLA motif protein [Patescibacteria group bacterium]
MLMVKVNQESAINSKRPAIEKQPVIETPESMITEAEAAVAKQGRLFAAEQETLGKKAGPGLARIELEEAAQIAHEGEELGTRLVKKVRDLVHQEEALDDRWYSRFVEVGSFQAYEYLDGDKAHREYQREQFITDTVENPSLDYPEIDIKKLSHYETLLLQLKTDILAQEKNDIVKQVYRWKLNEKIAELRMLKSVASGDSKKFKRYSEFIYGKPSSAIFAYTVDNLRKKINDLGKLETAELQTAKEELLQALPDNLGEVSPAQIPTTDTVDQMRQQTFREFGDIINISPEAVEKEYNAVEIRQIFTDILNDLRAEGWQVTIDTGSKAAMSVNQEHKSIQVPEDERIAFRELRELIVHEIGTHVARRINGERSKLHLLGLGLDRYEKGEEGVATMREQVLEDKV